MKTNIELLNHIYETAEAGKDLTAHIMEKVKDAGYCRILEAQANGYEQIQHEAASKLTAYGADAKGAGVVKKLSKQAIASLQTMGDTSVSRISALMIQGTTMGVTDILKNLNQYNGTDTEVADLGGRLLQMEQDNINTLKSYL